MRGPSAERIGYENLARICDEYRSRGLARFLIAAAVETTESLHQLQAAAGATDVIVCRLRAPLPVMSARVAAREQGIAASDYVARVPVLERILDAASLEAFTLSTDGLTVGEVAREMLVRAGWI